MRMILTVLAVSAVALSASAQAVPEGIHSMGSGPVDLCGVKAASVAELHAAAQASPDLHVREINSSRFELFANDGESYQLVFTRASEPAYPAATCRHVYDKDGSTRMERSMACGASREACDQLFLEFQNLDARITREVQGGG